MSVTGIASYATGLSQAQLAQDVGTRVARKALDQAKADGAAVNQLLQQAADLQQAAVAGEPHKGRIVDVLA
jgi:hypothetical protein